jgi:hypothetical protein
VKIVRAVRTCVACPSEWNAWTVDGQYLYLRYRFGCGTATKYVDQHFYDRHEIGLIVAEFTWGDWLDGEIDLDQFCAFADLDLGHRLRWWLRWPWRALRTWERRRPL